jgi:hypothetical protein
MEAESYNWSHLLIGEHLDYFLFLFVSRTLALWDEPNIECQSVRSLYGVRPLAASMEVKNNHAHVTTPIILYKFIEVNFYVGCMVWPWYCQFKDSTTMSLINKMKAFTFGRNNQIVWRFEGLLNQMYTALHDFYCRGFHWRKFSLMDA